jgi:hypothetical protein
MRRVGVALLTALALSTPVFAQSSDNRVSLNAAIGPSFANLGTTFSTTAGVDYTLNDRATLVGEFGVLPHAPFDKASTIAAPLATRIHTAVDHAMSGSARDDEPGGGRSVVA